MAVTAKDKINLSRAQRRANERVNNEVSLKLSSLIEKFYNSEALEIFDKEAQKIIDAYQKQLKDSL